MKLIATNIANLTDARFFAAYLPEVLFIPSVETFENLDALLTQFAAMKEWIEGAEWGLTIHSTPTPEVLKQLKKVQLETLLYDGSLDDFTPLDNFKIYCRTKADDLQQIQNIAPLKECTAGFIISDLPSSFITRPVVPVYLELQHLDDWRKAQGPVLEQLTGIVLQGGLEEKTGLKSFDSSVEIIENVIEIS